MLGQLVGGIPQEDFGDLVKQMDKGERIGFEYDTKKGEFFIFFLTVCQMNGKNAKLSLNKTHGKIF